VAPVLYDDLSESARESDRESDRDSAVNGDCGSDLILR
jgi:hypothetical protein